MDYTKILIKMLAWPWAKAQKLTRYVSPFRREENYELLGRH